jgi:hypothetical protein
MDKQNKIKASKLYKWVHDNLLTSLGSLFFLTIAGLIFGRMFWFPSVQQAYGYGYETNDWNGHGMNGWVLGILVFVIWELLYIWVCKNEKEIKKDKDILVAKIASLWLAFLIFTIIIPGIIMGWNFITTTEWLPVLKFVGYVIAAVVGIVAVLWLFFKSNQVIFHMIRGKN